MVDARRVDELANSASIGLRLQKRSLRTRPLRNRLSSIVETQRSDEVANQALDDFKNLFEKSFERGVAQILEVRIILTRALVGVA